MEIIDNHRAEQSRLMKIPRRQTVLLSATLSRGVERLAGLALTEPMRIDTADKDVTEVLGDTNELLVIPETLSQFYLLCPARLRLVTLAATLSHFIRVRNFLTVMFYNVFYVVFFKHFCSFAPKFCLALLKCLLTYFSNCC